jgi:hypothetical protein
MERLHARVPLPLPTPSPPPPDCLSPETHTFQDTLRYGEGAEVWGGGRGKGAGVFVIGKGAGGPSSEMTALEAVIDHIKKEMERLHT